MFLLFSGERNSKSSAISMNPSSRSSFLGNMLTERSDQQLENEAANEMSGVRNSSKSSDSFQFPPDIVYEFPKTLSHNPQVPSTSQTAINGHRPPQYSRPYDRNALNLWHCLVKGCAKTFSRRTGLESHAIVHSAHRPFKCPDCATSFKRSYDMRRHIKKCHKIDHPAYPSLPPS
jgi:hypothetical protein